MSRFNPAQWGQTRKINPRDWNIDPHNPNTTTPLTIVTKDGANPHEVQNAGELPWTKNLTLAVEFDPAETGDFALRWVISFGVGGGTEDFKIDAAGMQQLSLSADLIRVSLVAENPSVLGLTGFSTPTKGVKATAFYTQGATDTDAPTLTQTFQIEPAGSLTLPVPKFASGLRILGGVPPDDGGSATSPFQNGVQFSVEDFSGASIDQYTGNQLYGLRLAEIPTGLGTVVVVTSNLTRLLASIEWFIDC